jgi:hypothetical protein
MHFAIPASGPEACASAENQSVGRVSILGGFTSRIGRRCARAQHHLRR